MFEELAVIVAFLEIVSSKKSKFNFKDTDSFYVPISMFAGNKGGVENAIRKFLHTLNFFCLTKKKIANDQITAGIASSEGLVSICLLRYCICSFKVILWAWLCCCLVFQFSSLKRYI